MVVLQGEGVAAAVTLVPAAFDFGPVDAGARSPSHAFAVLNEGAAPLDLGAASIVGADLDQFTLAGDECTGETLAPGAACLLRVRFAPDSDGAKAARLRVASDAGAFVAHLAGSGSNSGSGPGSSSGPGDAGPAAEAWQSQGTPAPARKRGHRRFRRGATVSASSFRVHRRARGAAVRG
jgi:hypothetical protein